jgi:hypothetical protein
VDSTFKVIKPILGLRYGEIGTLIKNDGFVITLQFDDGEIVSFPYDLVEAV